MCRVKPSPGEVATASEVLMLSDGLGRAARFAPWRVVGGVDDGIQAADALEVPGVALKQLSILQPSRLLRLGISQAGVLEWGAIAFSGFSHTVATVTELLIQMSRILVNS